jgi:hypothetical protein
MVEVLLMQGKFLEGKETGFYCHKLFFYLWLQPEMIEIIKEKLLLTIAHGLNRGLYDRKFERNHFNGFR